MSKELEALNKIAYCYGFDENITIIETALKRLEMYDNVVGVGRIQDTNKKLKALEIIKEKKVNIGDFINACSNICYEQYKFMRNECCFVGIKRISNELTKEEYDLLKEVLL